MSRVTVTTAAALVAFAMSATAAAQDDWWDDGGAQYGSAAAHDDGYGHVAEHYEDGIAYAPVVDARPVYRTVIIRRPQRECWQEEVYDPPHRRHRGTAAATVTGGLIGGVIGRQFGDGKGRDAMTLVGTLIGSAMAHDQADRQHHGDYRHAPRYRTVERCSTRHTAHEERRLDGYHVTYVFAGREYTTRTARDPGDRIRVQVAVTPAGY